MTAASIPAGIALRAGEIADLPAFCAVDEDAASLERRWRPLPEKRIAMRRTLRS